MINTKVNFYKIRIYGNIKKFVRARYITPSPLTKVTMPLSSAFVVWIQLMALPRNRWPEKATRLHLTTCHQTNNKKKKPISIKNQCLLFLV